MKKVKMTMTNEDIIYENDFYQTADLSLAGVIFLFWPLEAINKQNPRKAQFLFKRSEELDRTVEQFWRGELKVEPQAYFNALRIIKARLYGEG